MNVKMLNAEQRRAIDIIMACYNVIISGKAGNGKTFIVKHIVELISKSKAVAVTCTTGMACTLYMQQSKDSSLVCRFECGCNGTFSFEQRRVFEKTHILIIHEISQ